MKYLTGKLKELWLINTGSPSNVRFGEFRLPKILKRLSKIPASVPLKIRLPAAFRENRFQTVLMLGLPNAIQQ